MVKPINPRYDGAETVLAGNAGAGTHSIKLRFGMPLLASMDGQFRDRRQLSGPGPHPGRELAPPLVAHLIASAPTRTMRRTQTGCRRTSPRRRSAGSGPAVRSSNRGWHQMG
jgi:hypothetical protein